MPQRKTNNNVSTKRSCTPCPSKNESCRIQIFMDSLTCYRQPCPAPNRIHFAPLSLHHASKVLEILWRMLSITVEGTNAGHQWLTIDAIDEHHNQWHASKEITWNMLWQSTLKAPMPVTIDGHHASKFLTSYVVHVECTNAGHHCRVPCMIQISHFIHLTWVKSAAANNNYTMHSAMSWCTITSVVHTGFCCWLCWQLKMHIQKLSQRDPN